MTLDKDIKDQYAAREHKAALYQSVYSDLSHHEKTRKAVKLVSDFIGDASNKTLLEIGAGQGDNVDMIKACGFRNDRIYLNELLPERARAIRQHHPEVHLYEGNALKIDFHEKYDCVFQSTVFTSILKSQDRKALAGKMWELLKPGGIILWYDFIYNNPSNPHVRKVDVAELRSYFAQSRNSKILKVTLAPPIGRRVGRLYPVFNLPFLRSHVLAVFQKP